MSSRNPLAFTPMPYKNFIRHLRVNRGASTGAGTRPAGQGAPVYDRLTVKLGRPRATQMAADLANVVVPRPYAPDAGPATAECCGGGPPALLTRTSLRFIILGRGSRAWPPSSVVPLPCYWGWGAPLM